MFSIRIVDDPDDDVSPEMMESIKEFVSKFLRGKTLTYLENGPKISLHLFFTVGLALHIYLENLKDDDFPQAKELKAELRTVVEDTQRGSDSKIVLTMFRWLFFITRAITRYGENYPFSLYKAEHKIMRSEKENCMYFQITVKRFRPKQRDFLIDGHKHKAFEVVSQSIDGDLTSISCPSSCLNLNFKSNISDFPIYIQKHAVNRIMERLDNVDEHLLYSEFIATIRKFDRYIFRNKRFYIEFYLTQKKVGYLLADIHEGHLLIHTFLFITNSGTPEGDILLSKTGLGKLDKSYLNIDKLSTFWQSDINDNPKVKQIFIEAGCKDILELPPTLSIKENPTEEKTKIASKLEMYLMLNVEEAEEGVYLREQLPEG